MRTLDEKKPEPLKPFKDTKTYISCLNVVRENEGMSDGVGGPLEQSLRQYNDLIRRRKFFDFSNILTQACALISSGSDAAEFIAKSKKHLIVDEYQDINPIQNRLIRQLGALGLTVTAVGDDDQTIYQWRGSDIRAFLKFPEQFSDPHHAILSHNFRSSQGIVKLADHIISQNQIRTLKDIVAASEIEYEEGDIQALTYTTNEQEVEAIIARIKELRGIAFSKDGEVRGLNYSDICILLRSVSADGERFTRRLEEEGIPFVVKGTKNLFARREVHAVRNIFYYVAGMTDIGTVVQAWRDCGLELSGEVENDFRSFLERAKGLIQSLEDPGRFEFYHLQRFFLNCLERLQLNEFAIPNGAIVFYNLGVFSTIISEFETVGFKKKVHRKYLEFANFLKYKAESFYDDGPSTETRSKPNAVQIMTVHQAKGLEWPAVFLPCLVRNRFPIKKSGGRGIFHVIPRQSVPNFERFENSVEDERRLFYVGITRSQKFLFLSWSPLESKLYRAPSDFFQDTLSCKPVIRRHIPLDGRKRAEPRTENRILNMELTFSELKFFYQCPYQYKLRVVNGFNPEIHESLGYGKSLHDTLAVIHKQSLLGHKTEKDDIAALVEANFNLPYAYDDLATLLKRTANKILTEYIEKNSDMLDRILFVEHKVSILITQNVTVSGKVDLIKNLKSEEVTIVDHKSKHKSQLESVTDDQLLIYAEGYRESTGSSPDYIEQYNLDVNKPIVKTYDAELARQSKMRIAEIAESIRSADFAPKACTHCEVCDMRRICPHGSRQKG